MYVTNKGWVKNAIGTKGFGFVQTMHGGVEIDIFIRQERLYEAGWKSDDFRSDLPVEVEFKELPDGRYVVTKLHQLDNQLAPNFYRLSAVDRDKGRGLTIFKVFDLSVSCALGFRVHDKNERLLGNYPSLVAARASIGRVIEPPRDVNHGVKTNTVVALPKEKEKKKKAA